MPARASWKGFLQVNQLSVPVKAFSAVSTGPEVPLNQLHRDCGQRIRQQKVCPVHGVLSATDIISGFEFAQDQYLPLNPEELDALRPIDEKAIAIECFVPCARIDPVYHSGRTYYLVPDGPPGQRPFGVLREGMRHTERHALALIVLANSQLLVLLRPMTRVLAMTVLEYPQRIRPAADYETEVSKVVVSDTEQQLVRQLIDCLTEPEVDLERYRDPYTDRLTQLIEQRLPKTDGAEACCVAPQDDEESSLVSALMASLSKASTPRERLQKRSNGASADGWRNGAGGLERKLG